MMSDRRQGPIWISVGDLQRLFSARHVCYLVGSYDGSGNYGDILQLDANARRVRAAGSNVLAAPLVYWRYVADHFALRDRHPELFEDSCFLYYVPDEDQEEAAEVLSEVGCVAIVDPPQAHSQTLVYGGGFFNSWWTWGVHKLDVIDLVTRWRGTQPAGSHALSIVGQQVSSNFLVGADADRFADLLDRATTIGVRDELSRELLQGWERLKSPDSVVLSGDDATMAIVDAGSNRRPNGHTDELRSRGPSRPYVVNVHLSLEQYVTAAPHQMLKAYEAVLRNVRRITGNALTVNLLVAYDDSRISERQYVDQLKASPALAGVTVNVVSCLDDLLGGFPLISDAQLTVSCSYHVALTSLLLGIPTAFVYANGYYWHKAEGLKRSFEIPDALLFDVRDGNCDAFSGGIGRLLHEPQFHARVSARAAQGAAKMMHRTTQTSASLAASLANSYITDVETRYRTTATRLLDSMEQLSDLRLEYGNLLNNATRLSTMQASAAQSGQHPANGYQRTVEEIRSTVGRLLPKDATALVVSRGDGELLKLDGREGWHFPQTPSGIYAGHHPADSAAATSHLEELRAQGAGYLIIPNTCFWWLDHYAGFRDHLNEKFQRIWSDQHCIVYGLAGTDDFGGQKMELPPKSEDRPPFKLS
jgi:polysaccharide pyruvyl transferase WcaK-like protein